MKTKALLCFAFCILCIVTACTITATTQDKKAKIIDYLDREIWIDDGWTGKSITLIKENEEYLVLLKYFGSGRPVTGAAKYKVEFKNDYQIYFSEIVATNSKIHFDGSLDPQIDFSEVTDASTKAELTRRNGYFILTVEDDSLNLYMKLAINENPYAKVNQK